MARSRDIQYVRAILSTPPPVTCLCGLVHSLQTWRRLGTTSVRVALVGRAAGQRTACPPTDALRRSRIGCGVGQPRRGRRALSDSTSPSCVNHCASHRVVLSGTSKEQQHSSSARGRRVARVGGSRSGFDRGGDGVARIERSLAQPPSTARAVPNTPTHGEDHIPGPAARH